MYAKTAEQAGVFVYINQGTRCVCGVCVVCVVWCVLCVVCVCVRRAYATSVCALKLLVYEALSY